MSKWVVILLAAMAVLAIVGFVVDAAKAIVGILFVACLIGLAVHGMMNRKASRERSPTPRA